MLPALGSKPSARAPQAVSGSGLAIVDRIAQRHGGRVVIGASPLGGASVTTWWDASAPSFR